MNKSELVEAIADNAEMTKAAASKALDSFMSAVTEALRKGEKVELTGFGSFSTTNRPAREGRNPRTGETIQIKAARVAKFKVGKSLKEAVEEV
jgi:DNA-binding protein HU-beta